LAEHTQSGDLGRHGRNISWLLIVDALWKILSIFYFAYVFEKLTKAENELYTLFISVLPMVMVINAFGFQDVVNREVAKRREAVHRLMGSALLAQFALFAAGAAATWLIAWSIGVSPEMRGLLLLWPVAGFLAAAAEMHNALFAAHERFRELSLITVLMRMITVGGALALLYAGCRVNALVGYVTGVYVIQLAMSYAVFRAKCGGYRLTASLEAVRYLFREGFTMAVGRVAATSYYRIDMPAIRLFGSQAMAIEYAVGPRFFVLLTTLPNTLESIFFPILSRKTAPGNSGSGFTVERFVKLTWLVALPMAVGMTVVGDDIVRMLAGEQYLSGVPVVIMFTWIVALAMFDRVAVVYLRAAGRQGAVMWIYAAALAAKSALCIPAIWFWGINGMLAVSVACSAAITLYTFAVIHALIPTVRLRTVLELGLRPAAASAVMAGVLLLAASWEAPRQLCGVSLSLFITVPVGAAAYLVSLVLLGALDEFDWQFLAKTLKIQRGPANTEVGT
jgi:O-antigen/teichoic acid export membrane protein